MLRPAILLSTLIACLWGLAIAQDEVNMLHFPSQIGSLELAMRHQAPTGVRRGPPVLILHGATFPSGNAAGWKIDGRSWMDELAAAGYEVYALDYLGFGASDRYPEMGGEAAAGAPLGGIDSMVGQVECAVAQILQAHGGEQINLIAHSAGTFVAARYAQVHPNQIARLVLFGAPAPITPPTHEPPLEQRYAHLDRAGELEGFETKVRDTQHLDSTMFEAWMNAYLATDAQSQSRHPASVRIPAGLMAAANDMDRLGQLPYDPQQITVPALVIQGEWDEVAPPAAGLWLYERLASPLKRFVIISQAGHRAQLEKNRGQLYRETETFLNGGDSADGPRYAVFFEVKPNGDKGRKAYLDTAGALRSRLDTISGFVSIERFDNESRPGWLLSLSHWRDEAALITWREVFEHRVAQEKGRHGVFADYRIRVARQVSAGGDLIVADETNSVPTASAQRFVSLSTPGHRLALLEGGGLPGGTHWQVIRDYGLHERRQAPHE